MFNVTVKTR